MGSPVLTPPGQPKPMQDGEFIASAAPYVVSFNTTNVAPPSPLYVQSDDQLGVVFMSRASADSVVITARILRAQDGVIVPISQTFKVAGAYSRISKIVQLVEGYLLSVTATSASQAQRGTSFAALYIIRGAISLTPLAGAQQVLASGYATQNQAIGWPGGAIVNCFDGQGFRTTNSPAPAAGQDWAFIPAANQVTRLWSVSATFTASGTAANRQIAFLFSANAALRVGATTNVTAGQAVTFNLGVGFTQYTDVQGNFSLPMPRNMFFVGNGASGVVASSTTNIQAGDQWSAITVGFEEYLNVG